LKLAFRSLQYSACEDSLERINLLNPDKFSIGASPKIIKEKSTRFGFIDDSQLMRRNETKYRIKKLRFRFKTVQIFTGFKLEEGKHLFKKLTKF